MFAKKSFISKVALSALAVLLLASVGIVSSTYTATHPASSSLDGATLPSTPITQAVGQFTDETGSTVYQAIELPVRDTLDALKSWALSPYLALKSAEWESKIAYRDVNHTSDAKIATALDGYRVKVRDIAGAYSSIADASIRQTLADKLVRIRDKAAACFTEQALRKAGTIRTSIHNTAYYIDLDGGNDGNTGLDTGQAWLTIEKYTSVTLRSAGDIAWVRANTSEVVGAADIVFDESGTANSYIEIRGCSSVAGEDPWADGNNTKPIIDFNNGAFQMLASVDSYWRLYRLDITNGADTIGLIRFASSANWKVDYCDLHLSTAATGIGVVVGVSTVSFTGTSFYSNKTYNLQVSSGDVTLTSCIFNGGAATTDYGLYLNGGAKITMSNTTFGTTTTHDTASVFFGTIAAADYVDARNCLFSDGTEIAGYTVVLASNSFVRSEDHDQVKGAQLSYYWNGTISRSAATQLDGLDSALMTPNASVGANQSLTLSGAPSIQGDYAIWCTAVAANVTIKARETVAWAADPTNTEFYIEVSYLSDAGGTGTRTTAASVEALSGINEITFSVGFTPAVAGWAYITVHLKKYEAGKTINVSIKPLVS